MSRDTDESNREMETRYSHEGGGRSSSANRGEFLLGMLVGASVGAALALLYAPASGNQTRETVKDAASDAMGRAGDLAGTLRERAPEVAGSVRSAASSAVGRAGDIASTVKERASGLVSRGQETTGAVADMAGSAADQVAGAAGVLPDPESGDRTTKRDQHELQTSDSPDVAADRINNAMQGSGEEAHQIAEDLVQAPPRDAGDKG